MSAKEFPPLHRQSEIPAVNELAEELQCEPDRLIVNPVDGGHMAYGRWLIQNPQDSRVYFAKGHRPELFTDPRREEHARQYLQKEQTVFEYLRSQNYGHVPEYSQLLGGSLLVMNALPPEQNWAWRADDSRDVSHYIESTLSCLDELQAIDIAPEEHFFPERIMKIYMEEGWDHLTPERVAEVQARIQEWLAWFHPETGQLATELTTRVTQFVEPGKSLYDTAQPLYLSHHDARQANLAHHIEHGTRLVDWSWADVGFKNADSTMFLIDLAKSEVSVDPYLASHFNPDHALLLMGHWLDRSIEPTRDGDTTVRFHQLTSAVTAYELLLRTGAL